MKLRKGTFYMATKGPARAAAHNKKAPLGNGRTGLKIS